MPPFDRNGNPVDCSGMMMFYRDKDGNMVPFTGIQLAEVIEENVEFVRSWIPEQNEFTFTAELTKQSARKWKKMVRKYDNKVMRTVRTIKRRKEKYRRARLKAGGHQ